jgi:hypothetical protein
MLYSIPLGVTIEKQGNRDCCHPLHGPMTDASTVLISTATMRRP